MSDDLQYSIDLSMAQSRAEKIIECLKVGGNDTT
jgi:hypothetical protein